ncbi:choice-of-anchor Q domain-containing protein [Chloroflexota bacterium]
MADNGGFAPTHALLDGSPAIDGVLSGYCTTIGIAVPGEAVTEDERGVARPQDGDGDGQAFCDIGAYEYEYTQPPSPPPPASDFPVGGEVYPTNKATIVARWIAIAAAILAVGVILRRRRAYS